MNKHILITTVGAGDRIYDETVYSFDGHKTSKTRFFSRSLLEYLTDVQPIDQVVVLLTGLAKIGKNWNGDTEKGIPGLKDTLRQFGNDHHQLKIVTTADDPIPDGITESEVWALFNRISSLVDDGCLLTLDLTHGFRSLPLIMLLTVAYLRSAKNITINAVYYGAYAAGNIESSPALDLTPFLTLFDWVTAVDAFEETGDLGAIADLMRNRQDSLFKSPLPDKSKLPSRFKSIAQTMTGLSESLLLGRLSDIIEPLKKLNEQIGQQEENAKQWLAPLTAQINRISASFEGLIPSTETSKDYLLAQFNLIKWYVEHGHILNAGLLLREWFVTWYMCQSKSTLDWRTMTTNTEEREKAEHRINILVNALRNEVQQSNLKFSANANDEAINIVDVWDMLSGLRNDLGHFGHRPNPLDTKKTKDHLDLLIKTFEPLVKVSPESRVK